MTQTTLDDRDVWACEVCALAYEDEDLAKRCEDHCRTEDSCSMEIGRQAVGSVGDDVRFEDR